MLDAAHRLALRIDARRLALVEGALIAGVAVMGILRYGNKEQLGAFNLDGERNVPAVFSAALWTVVSGLAAGVRFTLFALAAGAGVVSQLLEQVQYGENDEPVRGYRVMVVSEEVAAVLISLSFLAVLRALADGRINTRVDLPASTKA